MLPRHEAFGLSDQGRVRKTNEDAFVCADDLDLYVVADGMGGHNAGEVASALAIEAITGFIRRSAMTEELSWPYGLDPSASFDANRLCTAIKLANRRVFRAAEERDEYTGMGTTVVAALLTPETVVVGHVGDSRLYVKSGGDLRQMTVDDSWAATILIHERPEDSRDLTRHPMRNVLTNVLGARDQVEVHLQELPRRGGDVLMLCSDGLYGPLDLDDIDAIISSGEALAIRGRRLVDAALAAGSRDNVTVVLVNCNGGAR